ncbi:MAG: hypothetical protein NTW01_19260, partial [Gammaproteobacteria bacterium]|nr:hypothetical protein [Gammaproteobacteria bacterium]
IAILWPRFATKSGGFLAATLRGGAVFAHCCLSRRANGSTIGRSDRVALGKNDLRRSKQIN